MSAAPIEGGDRRLRLQRSSTRLGHWGLAAVVAGLVTFTAAAPAGAIKSQRFLLIGQDQWSTHDAGWFPVVQGPAEIQLHNGRTLIGTLTATIQPDDHSMPAPGECETAIAFVYVDGDRRADTVISGAGDVCGLYLQPPNVVTHAFTAWSTIEESGMKPLEGSEGFLEIRLANDGRAHVFASVD